MNMFTTDTLEYWMFMACSEYEERIINHLDGQVAEPERQAVEAHLAACVACRNFARELGRLDTALASTFRPPALSPGFKDRVLHRVDAEAIPTTPNDRLQKKQAVESEYHQLTAGLIRQIFRDHFTTILDSLGCVGLALLLGFSLNLFATPATALLSHLLGIRSLDSTLLLPLALSAASVLLGMGFGFERWIRWAARYS